MEARYYEKLNDNRVQCHLCPHECVIAGGKSGLCRVRQNKEGTLIATTYGKVAAAGMDPIEKKPLYHFHPNSQILSLGQAGCTFHCQFCQNCHMLSPDIPQQSLSPEEAVQLARQKSSDGIAYTYNEPYVGFEYVIDTARLAQDNGLKNVMVTNGFYMPDPFDELAPLVDAMNIDLKSMTNSFYKEYCRGAMEPVHRTIEDAFDRGIHVELTTLLITDLNDSDKDIKQLVDYVANISPTIPLHLSRYHPAYQMDRPATPEKVLKRAYDLASEKLQYVYIGNVVGMGGANTYCPECGEELVSRSGFRARIEGLDGSRCGGCGADVNFVN
ncbi:MAG: AmmeMemoRadiSam system radical SAM enzyme [Planctomycetota bacterium]